MDGAQTCVNRQWGNCLGEIVPAAEVCDGSGRDEDCDGQVDEGFDQAAPVTCSRHSVVGMSGDSGADTLTRTGHGEFWYGAEFYEWDDSLLGRDITGRITLSSPPGVNFDLSVYCGGCDGVLIQSSTNGPGMQDQVIVRNWDLWGVVQTVPVTIHIHRVDEGVCAQWTLTIEGNTAKGGTSNPTCGW